MCFANIEKVDVIIPAYKAEKLIERGLESLKLQKNYIGQVIIIEDGIYDNTSCIVKKYNDELKIRYIVNTTNKGAQFSRNLGLKYSISNYVLFLDSDDWLDINFFENFNLVIRNNSYQLIFGNVKSINEKNNSIQYCCVNTANTKIFLILWFLGFHGVGPCAVIWDRRFIEQIGGWNEKLTKNQDGDIVLRALYNEVNWKVSNKITAFAYDHDGERISKMNDISAFKSQIIVLKEFIKNSNGSFIEKMAVELFYLQKIKKNKLNHACLICKHVILKCLFWVIKINASRN